jgi:hypothetical protein
MVHVIVGPFVLRRRNKVENSTKMDQKKPKIAENRKKYLNSK